MTQSILEVFTMLETRAVEQAYIKYYAPLLNGTADVALGLKWSPDVTRLQHDPAPTTVYTESGEIKPFDSTTEAAAYTDLSMNTIRARYNRVPPLWSFSTKLKENVHFRRPHESDVTDAPPKFKPVLILHNFPHGKQLFLTLL